MITTKITFIDILTPYDAEEYQHVETLEQYLKEGWQLITAVSMGERYVPSPPSDRPLLNPHRHRVPVTRFYFQRKV